MIPSPEKFSPEKLHGTLEERDVEEKVKKLKEVWEKNEEGFKKIENINEIIELTEKRLDFPETPPFLLEKVLSQFIKEFELKKYDSFTLGAFISGFINKNIDNYLIKEKERGKKTEEIKEIVIRLNVENLKEPLSWIGVRNREKSHLIIKGDCGNSTGREMRGGEIEVQGSCKDNTGFEMVNGKIKVEGDCGDWTGLRMLGGEIEIERSCGNWTGFKMSGGKIKVKKNCGDWAGFGMANGILLIDGEVKSFDSSAFSSQNKGEIWHKSKKIWPRS